MLDSSCGSRSRGSVLRLCAGLSLLVLLFIWFDFSSILTTLRALDATFVAAALCLFVLQFGLSLLRWVYILRRQSLSVRWRDAVSIYGVGTLANLFLITSIAGISVRAALLVRRGSGISGALASLAVERLAAVAGMAACGTLGLLVALPSVKAYLVATRTTFYLDMVAASLLALILVAVVVALRIPATSDFLSRLWLGFSSAGATVLLTLLSAAIVLLGFAGMAVLAGGMDLSIDPLFFVAVMPAVAFVSALPISVGGWGVREGMMVAGLAMFSVPGETAVALSISYGLAGLLVAAVLGGCLAVLGASDAHQPA